MAKIASFGAYIPLFRLARQEMADAWGVPAVPGELSVANADEDSLTMAVAAGADCLVGWSRRRSMACISPARLLLTMRSSVRV